jgi:hypothetical protein
MEILDLQNQLFENRLLRSSDEIRVFEDTVAQILELNDANHIDILCSGFDDLTEQDEVMFGLIHTVEHYINIVNPEIVLEKIALAANRMIPKAEEWYKILQIRILNNNMTRVTYKKVLKMLNKEQQDIVISQLEKIKREDQMRFDDIINFVLGK